MAPKARHIALQLELTAALLQAMQEAGFSTKITGHSLGGGELAARAASCMWQPHPAHPAGSLQLCQPARSTQAALNRTGPLIRPAAAGMAALLGLMLQKRGVSRIECYGFATPPCCTPPLAHKCEDFFTDVAFRYAL